MIIWEVFNYDNVLQSEKIKTGENVKKIGKKKQDGPETGIGVAAEEKTRSTFTRRKSHNTWQKSMVVKDG